MKEPIVLPFVFLFAFICVMIAFTALDLFAAWGYMAVGEPFNIAFVLQRAPTSALQAMIPAVVTSLVFVGFRLARKPFSRFLGLLISLGVSYLVLVNGMILLKGVPHHEQPAASAALRSFTPRSFIPMGGPFLDVQSVAGDEVKGALLYEPDAAQAQKLNVFPTGRVSVAGTDMTVRLTDGTTRQLSRAIEPAFGSLFVPDRFTSLFLRDIDVVTSDFQALLSRSLGEFFAACFSLLFLVAASMAILRFTRWPLINVLLFILSVRGDFFLYHLLAVGIGSEVGRIVSDPLVVRLFPSVAMAVIGVVFVLIDILFLPADRFRQTEAA